MYETSRKYDLDRRHVSINDALHQFWCEIEAFASDAKESGLSTGFFEFDHFCGGFSENRLIVIAGRPAMGKTAFALNIARNAAVGSGKSVCVFSNEYGITNTTRQFIAAQARIDGIKIRAGLAGVTRKDMEKMEVAVEQLKSSPLWLCDIGSLSFSYLF